MAHGLDTFSTDVLTHLDDEERDEPLKAPRISSTQPTEGKAGKHLIDEPKFRIFSVCCPSLLEKFSAFRS
jgi:hypothetical protein